MQQLYQVEVVSVKTGEVTKVIGGEHGTPKDIANTILHRLETRHVPARSW